MVVILFETADDDKEARKRETARRYRQANREKIREYQRLRLESDPEAAARAKIYAKRSREKNKAKIAARKAAYKAAHREQANEINRRSYARHSEEIREKFRARYYREHDKQLLRHSVYRAKIRSINVVRHSPDDVMRLVNRTISDALPGHMRDDIRSNIILAVLEGKLLLDQVGKRIQDYVRAYNREYDTHKHVQFEALQWRL